MMNSLTAHSFPHGIPDSDVEAFRASSAFDQQWYLDEYTDVAISGLDPALHYLWIGQFLGRKSAPDGNTKMCLPTVRDIEGRQSPISRDLAWNEAFAIAQGARSPDFAPPAMTHVKKEPGSPILAAFYLPQFHPIKENDEWWGIGFTEWTNVSKAVPQFHGHHQPRLPLDLGFYDLRNIDVMRAQVALAKTNGISAFCFHYYWFDGRRLLEKPVESYLADGGKSLDLPFFLCWANENWTRRWDGSESEILMEQSHSLDDHSSVFHDLNRFFSDPRYLKLDGKPVVVIYRPGIIKDLAAMVTIWRRAAAAAGLPGIHLVATNSFGFSDPASIGFDGLCEFPPHNVVATECSGEKQWYNPNHEGNVYSYQDVVDFCIKRMADLDDSPSARNYYPTVMMGWDNEARKPGRGNIFDGCTPSAFHRWLDASFSFSSRNHKKDQGLVFVNAWNEWAEGTHLEPDRRFGHAYLWAVRAVFEERVHTPAHLEEMIETANTAAGPRSADCAICVHLFYPDLIDELAGWIEKLRRASEPVDVLISLPATWSHEKMRQVLSLINPKRTFLVKNRGRDILPFIEVAREAARMGYTYGCKVHSKKSPHTRDGNKWRASIYSALLSVDTAKAARECFIRHPQCGIYAPSSMLKSCKDPNTMRDNFANVGRITKCSGGSFVELHSFIAGTMFWFRLDAIKAVLAPSFDQKWFGPELGAIDGTMAHAFERVMVQLCESNGYELMTYPGTVFDPYQ